MSRIAEDLAALVSERLGDLDVACGIDRGQVGLEVPCARLREVAERVRDDPELRFRQLVDLCGVDYLDYGVADWETSDMTTGTGYSRGVQKRVYAEGEAREGEHRFAVVYHLLSHERNRRLRLRVHAHGEPPRVDSVVDIWPAANWFEREAFDLYGVLFVGHPDLRRILTDYGFVGHPFRKDFPLIGEVEMRYDPEKRRVIYEPVSIEPRTLVPKTIRHDERYAREVAKDEPGDAGDAMGTP